MKLDPWLVKCWHLPALIHHLADQPLNKWSVIWGGGYQQLRCIRAGREGVGVGRVGVGPGRDGTTDCVGLIIVSVGWSVIRPQKSSMGFAYDFITFRQQASAKHWNSQGFRHLPKKKKLSDSSSSRCMLSYTHNTVFRYRWFRVINPLKVTPIVLKPLIHPP